MRWPEVVALAVLAAGCADPTLTPQRHGSRLVEKGGYQSLHGADGKIDRLLHDRNGDRQADAIILYAPTGKIHQAELDTDLDGVIDRWEYFEDGVLIRVGFSRVKRGVPDYWERMGADGTGVTHREYDDNGDGAIDRSEPTAVRLRHDGSG